jgi:cytochrome d ubiquinol oxidase subunit I
MEGHFETKAGAPLILLGWPDPKAEETLNANAIPNLGSFILTHDWNGTVRGLKEWPKTEWPNALILFWSFRIMVGLGFLMFAIGLWSLWGRLRRRLYEMKALHVAALLMGPMGFVAVIAGWVTTEAGRQPYTVYGLLRTADSAAPVAAQAVAASLAAFGIVYFAVFGAGVFYLLRLMNAPPHEGAPDSASDAHLRSAGIVPAPALDSVDQLAAHREER